MSQTEFPPEDRLGRAVTLIFGRLAEGGLYWCYVAVKPQEYDRLQALIAAKTFDIRDFEKLGFGEIIVSGEGSLPPPDVTKKVAAMFNVPIRELFAETDLKTAMAKKEKSDNQ